MTCCPIRASIASGPGRWPAPPTTPGGRFLARDLAAFGAAVRRSYEAQIAMFPKMVTPQVEALIAQHRDHALGWKLSGAGGGGYLILVAGRPIPNAVRIVARRASD